MVTQSDTIMTATTDNNNTTHKKHCIQASFWIIDIMNQSRVAK